VEFSEYGIVILSSVPSPCIFDPAQGTIAFAADNESTRPTFIGVDEKFNELGPDSDAVSAFYAPGAWGPARIWKVNPERQLIFTSKNTVYIARDNSSGIDDFKLTGKLAVLDPVHTEEVTFYFV